MKFFSQLKKTFIFRIYVGAPKNNNTGMLLECIIRDGACHLMLNDFEHWKSDDKGEFIYLLLKKIFLYYNKFNKI